MSENASQYRDVLTSLSHPSYRVHFMDPNGRVLRIKPLKASNDTEAILITIGLMDGRALDLWDGLRFIQHFPVLDDAG